MSGTYHRIATLLLLGLLPSAGCHDSRSPSAADTNTNWLQPCAAQEECPAGRVCAGGFCRPREDTGGAETGAAPGPDGFQNAVQAPRLRIGPPELLSEPFESVRTAPRIAWTELGWAASWTSSPPFDDDGPPEPLVVELFPEGTRFSRHMRGPSAPIDWTVMGHDAYAAAIRAPREAARSCSLQVLRPYAGPQEQFFRVDCSPQSHDFEAAGVFGSDDWLLTFKRDGGERVLGRFHPEEQAWVVEPVAIAAGTANDNVLALHAAGEDALVAWGADAERLQVARVKGVAHPTDPETAGDTSTIELAGRGPHKALAFTKRGALEAEAEAPTLLFGTDGEVLWTAPLGDEGDEGDQRDERDQGDEGRAQVRVLVPQDVAPYPIGATHAPELGLTVACYGTTAASEEAEASGHATVACVAVDRAGNGSTPMVIAEGLDRVLGVDAAWSGESLLVAYRVSMFSTEFGWDQRVISHLVTPL